MASGSAGEMPACWQASSAAAKGQLDRGRRSSALAGRQQTGGTKCLVRVKGLAVQRFQEAVPTVQSGRGNSGAQDVDRVVE